MPYIFLSTAAAFVALSGIGAKFYNRINATKKDTAAIYNLLQIGVVFLFWLVKFLLNPEMNIAVVPYSLIFSLGYTSAIVASVSAYREGPFMLSSLIMQLSQISATVWGFFFWGSPVTPVVVSGLVLVVISLYLCLYTGKKDNEKKITPKWLLYITLYFVGNSVGAITQRTQQIEFNSAYGDFLMAGATAISFIVCAARYLQSDKSDTKAIVTHSAYLPILAGAFNFLLNMIIIFLATSSLSPSLIYPVLAVVPLAINTIFSVFVFKEKMFWWQWIGVVAGALAVVLLSV